jgi:hypothetical protein
VTPLSPGVAELGGNMAAVKATKGLTPSEPPAMYAAWGGSPAWREFKAQRIFWARIQSSFLDDGDARDMCSGLTLKRTGTWLRATLASCPGNTQPADSTRRQTTYFRDRTLAPDRR